MRLTSPSPILLAALCVAFGAVIDAIVKGVTAEAAVLTLLAWRFLFGGSFALSIYVAQGKPRPSARAVRFHAMRAVIQLASAFLFFWSLGQLALAEATVIGFTAALMVAPLASVILGEKVSRVSLSAAVAGFAGALFAISAETGGAPEDANRVLGAGAAFVAAFLYALTLVLVRLRAREEDPLTIVMFTNVFPALLLLPVLIAGLPALSIAYLPVFALLGALGFGVWWLFTIAYSNAPAQRLAPLEYTALIWAAILGGIFFGEVPGWRLYIGALFIIAACLIVAFQDPSGTRTAAAAPLSDLPD